MWLALLRTRNESFGDAVRCRVGECRLSQLRASDQHLFDLLPRIVALCEMPSAELFG